eukprot:46378-Prymnesium_polylepis.1
MGRLRGSGTATWLCLWRVRRRINPVTKWRLRWTPRAEPYQSAIAGRARAFAGSWADGRRFGHRRQQDKRQENCCRCPPGPIGPVRECTLVPIPAGV